MHKLQSTQNFLGSCAPGGNPQIPGNLASMLPVNPASGVTEEFTDLFTLPSATEMGPELG